MTATDVKNNNQNYNKQNKEQRISKKKTLATKTCKKSIIKKKN